MKLSLATFDDPLADHRAWCLHDFGCQVALAASLWLLWEASGFDYADPARWAYVEFGL